ncbi:hypothetical protein IW140_004546 [Coemansia sp. RSA 1813]|nr:hypothetical protein EV178_004610 [Coemansia sp. RSA 1646]KAJ1766322.1 hypothetical protein LPJ74_005941 [Coemansia sp. RSA 1843]KAJ2087138.1 hypothetical protein IW138_005185 [Coemansia sp. RSA 986]KAJ2212657.1 hypothetical protein EV179_004483 [Coemansia sp. RSA 487]KAJ2567333.1 hypothetical protein IW140_004546 [Coemansia sp. RSA 1813]
MFSYTSAIAFTLLALSAALLAAQIADASAEPVPAAAGIAAPANMHVAKRCGGCGGWGGFGGGFGGFGFPFASSFTNALNTNNNAAHFNDDTLFVNNRDGNAVNSNFNAFANNNVVV